MLTGSCVHVSRIGGCAAKITSESVGELCFPLSRCCCRCGPSFLPSFLPQTRNFQLNMPGGSTCLQIATRGWRMADGEQEQPTTKHNGRKMEDWKVSTSDGVEQTHVLRAPKGESAISTIRGLNLNFLLPDPAPRHTTATIFSCIIT